MTDRVHPRNIDRSETTDIIRLLQLKFFIDAECLLSALCIGMIVNVDDYDELTAEQLRSVLEFTSSKLKGTVTTALYQLVK